jgi:hypothetical protein
MTSMDKNETSSEIEREAEVSRAHLAMTLDQLRHNLTPQHIADELLGNARHGASVVLKALGETAADNPVPALLLSAACAMFFFSAKSIAHSPSPDVPARERATVPAESPVKERRWAVLGERPVVTAIMGVVIGSSLAAMLPRAKSDDTIMSDKFNSVAAE